jgi:hypothetical protein
LSAFVLSVGLAHRVHRVSAEVDMRSRARNQRQVNTQDRSASALQPVPHDNSLQMARLPEQSSEAASGFLDGVEADGPFTGEVNALLTACFGDLTGIEASWSNEVEGVGANATTEGTRMVFGSSVQEDVDDPFSMEVIAHEVSHALAGGGSGQTELDEAGDPGEAIAYRAGERFASFATGGTSAPDLSPAGGGRARVHRHNSLEHKDAVDGAVDRLPETPENAQALALLEKKVSLENGMELTPGQISMLMGDYFGVMRTEPGRERELDPMASWKELSTTDPEKLALLLKEIDKEASGEASAHELNKLTDGRYASLALVNDCHFSSSTNYGTDNNVGTYEHFHALALHAAQEDENLALGLEASGMHFLTDRHAPGHLMEMRGVQEAAGGHFTTAEENLHVKHVHDHHNAEGKVVENAEGERWTAYGDGKWATKENSDSRRQVAASVGASYRELGAVLTNETNAFTALMDGADATRTLPMYEEDHQDACEMQSHDLPCGQAKLEMLNYLVK